MKRLFFTKTLIIATILASVPTAAAVGQESLPPNKWASFDSSMSYSGNGVTKKRRATIDYFESLYTTSTTENGLLFSCIAGHFIVTASLTPRDLKGDRGVQARRRKGRYIDVRFDDKEKVSLGVWTYKPTLGVISNQKRSQAAKLYNAAIRGQKVTLYMMGHEPVVLILPKPNKAFAEFGAECGIGTLAKRNKH